MSNPATIPVILRAVILSVEALLDRHIEVLGRSPLRSQDYEVFELRETITEARKSLKQHKGE